MHSCWLHTAICSSAAAGAFEPRAHTAQSCRRSKACRKPQHLSRPKPASTAQQIMMLTQTCLPCPHLFVFDPICFHSLRQSAHHRHDATKIDGSNTNLKTTDFTLILSSNENNQACSRKESRHRRPVSAVLLARMATFRSYDGFQQMGDDVVSVAPSRGVSDISGVELGSVMSSEPQVYVELSIFEGR